MALNSVIFDKMSDDALRNRVQIGMQRAALADLELTPPLHSDYSLKLLEEHEFAKTEAVTALTFLLIKNEDATIPTDNDTAINAQTLSLFGKMATRYDAAQA